MAGEKRSRRGKGNYATYPTKYSGNRKRRLARHVKNHPEDTAAAEKLANWGNGDVPYRRKKPVAKHGWNRARPSEAFPNSHENIMSELSPADAKHHAHMHRVMRQPDNYLSAADQKALARTRTLFENLEEEQKRRQARKKGGGKQNKQKGGKKS